MRFHFPLRATFPSEELGPALAHAEGRCRKDCRYCDYLRKIDKQLTLQLTLSLEEQCPST